MKIKYVDQITTDSNNIHRPRDFLIEGNKLTVTFDGITEIFDFNEIEEDGWLNPSEIEHGFDICPILDAFREEGEWNITLLNSVPLPEDFQFGEEYEFDTDAYDLTS
jgi:hypothetical protein